MSSWSQSSSSLPVSNCTDPLLDFDLQEKFLLPHAAELNNKNVYTLMQNLSENETQNTNLRRKLLERENHIKELSSKLQLEKVNVQKQDQLSRSLKAVQTHLQCQIQRKEVKNKELKAKIQALEKKIAEWKLRVGECKHQMLVMRETSEQKKTTLKKVIKSQKQRAEHLGKMVENLISTIKEREIRLSEILSASDVWKNQHKRIVEEITSLNVQTQDLKKQVTNLFENLKREEEWKRNSDEELIGKLNSLTAENESIYLENEKLKACLVTLENNTASVENELLDLREKAKWQENLVQQYKNQVSSTRKNLSFSQEEDGITSVGSHSLEEENHNIQKKYEDLKRQLEKMDFQNEELARQLRKEDECLQCSKLQLEEKTAEYNVLIRQLESALEDGRKMVAEELEKMSYKEQTLQTKMLILETEVRKAQEEKKELLRLFNRNEKHHEVHLKELENNLQNSENKNQSMQNYVQFLKATYITMFG
ncbi:protein BCAP isoform X8 [Pogoniulus pusillus]|uniref:protein BCAP isoform X8 n=1 Tax=Pogoniulus pusillus TaxID=488313 RepID=UPI0030B94D34